jgi:hypothetical protein
MDSFWNDVQSSDPIRPPRVRPSTDSPAGLRSVHLLLPSTSSGCVNVARMTFFFSYGRRTQTSSESAMELDVRRNLFLP